MACCAAPAVPQRVQARHIDGKDMVGGSHGISSRSFDIDVSMSCICMELRELASSGCPEERTVIAMAWVDEVVEASMWLVMRGRTSTTFTMSCWSVATWRRALLPMRVIVFPHQHPGRFRESVHFRRNGCMHRLVGRFIPCCDRCLRLSACQLPRFLGRRRWHGVGAAAVCLFGRRAFCRPLRSVGL